MANLRRELSELCDKIDFLISHGRSNGVACCYLIVLHTERIDCREQSVLISLE